jgi:hypothetical protein
MDLTYKGEDEEEAQVPLHETRVKGQTLERFHGSHDVGKKSGKWKKKQEQNQKRYSQAALIYPPTHQSIPIYRQFL